MTKVLVNGTFDIMHVGHLELLAYAKSLGDFLVVGIDSDARVKSLKGSSRPINNEYERLTMLAHNKWVDEVVVFNSDTELISLVNACDIMVKGSDYRGKPVIGQDVCKQLIFFERINGYSTTEKIKHIIDR
jgi:D-beta-D-heptose 7-phosphate kinase/D-beta-D-heptose 1-phosphate adenosyltransferase